MNWQSTELGEPGYRGFREDIRLILVYKRYGGVLSITRVYT